MTNAAHSLPRSDHKRAAMQRRCEVSAAMQNGRCWPLTAAATNEFRGSYWGIVLQNSR